MLINLYVLTVHGVIFNILYPDRLKGARPYMERDFGLGNTGGIELIQQGLIKMQTGGGSSNRTIAATIKRLITLPVFSGIFALDIRRKRHMAKAAHHLFDGARLWSQPEANPACPSLALTGLICRSPDSQ